jgi:hypothetical protein
MQPRTSRDVKRRHHCVPARSNRAVTAHAQSRIANIRLRAAQTNPSSIRQGRAVTDSDITTTSDFLLYQTEDGRTRIQCRMEEETLWLSQAQMAELFQTTPQNIMAHLKSVYGEEELGEAATCKSYLQVRTEGNRSVSREVKL